MPCFHMMHATCSDNSCALWGWHVAVQWEALYYMAKGNFPPVFRDCQTDAFGTCHRRALLYIFKDLIRSLV